MQALRLAMAEMHLDAVPAHAAVDGAVRLVRAGPGGARLAGLVNAVARRVADGGPALWAATPEAGLPGGSPARSRRPGGRRRGRRSRRRTGCGRRSTSRRARRGRRTPGPPRSAPSGCRPGASGSRHWPQVSRLPGYAEGAWWVQDAAAALPARLFGAARRARRARPLRGPGRQDDAARGRRGVGRRGRRLRGAAGAAAREPRPHRARGRGRRRRRARLGARAAVRGGAARRPLHGDRHDPPPPRPALAAGRRARPAGSWRCRRR